MKSPFPTSTLMAMTIAGASALVVAQQAGVDPRPPNAPNQSPAPQGQTRAPEKRLDVAFDIVTVVEGLQNPWSVAFLPGGKMLVTERPGRLRVLGPDGKLSEPVAGLPPVDARGQGGLLDVALDPAFAKNQTIYWSYAEPREGGVNNTAVAKGTFVDGAAAAGGRCESDLSPGAVVELAAALRQPARVRPGWHPLCDPGRALDHRGTHAGPADGWPARQDRAAQPRTDRSPRTTPSWARRASDPRCGRSATATSSPPRLHPTTGELWEVEHGTRGGDEINVARKGKDYGWPTIAYGIEYRGGPITGDITAKNGMEQPLYYWDPVIGPSGMVFYTADLFPAWKGSLFIGGHATNDLVRLSLDGEKVIGEERLLKDLKARIRDVRQGPDGALYLLTDSANAQLLKLVPKK